MSLLLGCCVLFFAHLEVDGGILCAVLSFMIGVSAFRYCVSIGFQSGHRFMLGVSALHKMVCDGL